MPKESLFRASFAARMRIYEDYGLLILAEDMAVQYKPEPNTVLVRINDDQFAPLKYPDHYDDILEVLFADIDQPSIYDQLMTEEQAQQIFNFMEKYRDKKFVVHCQAGISRSSAVGCAWAYMNGLLELEEKIRRTPCFYPNAHVYRRLINAMEDQVGLREA